MQGGKHTAGIAVEHIFCLVVAYAVDDSSYSRLNVDVCIFGTHLSSYNHETGAAECLARHLRLWILAEEFIKDGIGNLIRHLVRVSFRHRFGSEKIIVVHII